MAFEAGIDAHLAVSLGRVVVSAPGAALCFFGEIPFDGSFSGTAFEIDSCADAGLPSARTDETLEDSFFEVTFSLGEELGGLHATVGTLRVLLTSTHTFGTTVCGLGLSLFDRRSVLVSFTGSADSVPVETSDGLVFS